MEIVIAGILQASSYVYGAGLIGKYIRRAKVNTVHEYFGMRFHSKRLHILASVTLRVAVTTYLLSAIQGVSTLMTQITGLNNQICVILAWPAFAVFTVYSGSMGVLVTATIMFLIFFAAALVGISNIISEVGGWNEGIAALATSTTNPGVISWTNNMTYLYPTSVQNLIWVVVYEIVLTIVVMISPLSIRRLMKINAFVAISASKCVRLKQQEHSKENL